MEYKIDRNRNTEWRKKVTHTARVRSSTHTTAQMNMLTNQEALVANCNVVQQNEQNYVSFAKTQ